MSNLKYKFPPTVPKEYSFRQISVSNEIESISVLISRSVQLTSVSAAVSSSSLCSAPMSGKEKYTRDAVSVNAGQWFGAFCDDQVVACIKVTSYPSSVSDERVSLPVWLRELRPCELSSFVVHPGHRRRKYVVLMMMRMALDYAFQISDALCILPESQRLGEFYIKMGMRESGVHVRSVDNYLRAAEILYFNSGLQCRYDTPLYRLSDRYLVNLVR